MTFEEADKKYFELSNKDDDSWWHFTVLYSRGEYDKAAEEIEQQVGCDHEIAVRLVKKYSAGIKPVKSDPNVRQQFQQYIPKCPTCGSPNIQKQFLTGGWFSKQFRCNNCGYEW